MDKNYLEIFENIKENIPLKPIPKLQTGMTNSFMGIVTGYKPPTKTKGTDFSASIIITDPIIGINIDGLSINIFNPNPDELPVVKMGDIVRCSVKVVLFGRRLQGLINKNAPGSIQIVQPDDLPDLPEYEIQIYTFLNNWCNSLSALPSVKRSLVRPVLTISQLEAGKYCDTYVKVVCMHDALDHKLLGVTDFTTHNELSLPASHLENFNESGLPNDMLIALTLWDENIKYPIVLGMYIALRNVHVKYDAGSRLELSVHGDSRFPEKLQVKMADPDIPQVVALKMREAGTESQAVETVEKVADLVASQVHSQNGKQNLPQSANQTTPSNIPDSVPFTSISDILKSTQTPNKYKIKCKVLDYLPARLEHFCRPYCSNCSISSNPGKKEAQLCSMCDSEITEYCWMFSFLVQDESMECLPVIFSGPEAINFLGLYPTALTYQSDLDQLKEKLGEMWTLPKTDKDPFMANPQTLELCIESYTVKLADDQYSKRYKWFQNCRTSK